MKRLIALALVPLLTGCPTMQQPSTFDQNAKNTIKVDPQLVKRCEELPALQNGAELDVLQHYSKIITAYRSCAIDKQNLVDLLCGTLFKCETPQ